MREIIEGIRAEVPRLHIGVRLSAFESAPFKPDPAQSVPGALGPGIPEKLQPALSLCFRQQSEQSARIRPDRDQGTARNDARVSRPLRQRDGGKPLLQSAHHQAGALSAVRRLSSAGRSLRRRGAADFRGARAEGRVPGFLLHGQRLYVSAGVLPQRRAGRGAPGLGRSGRPRPHGACLSGTAARYSARQADPEKAFLPHLQRLHHRAAKRHRLRLLSARCAR